MVASVDIVEYNTAGGSFTTKTSGTIRFKAADNPTVDANDPITIPAAGSAFSYEKWLALRIGGTPPGTSISNLKVYTDGTNGFGTGVLLWSRTAAAFSTPASLSTTAGLGNFFTLTAGNALSLGTGPFSGTSTTVGSFLVLTLEVASTATQGSIPAENITFLFDET